MSLFLLPKVTAHLSNMLCEGNFLVALISVSTQTIRARNQPVSTFEPGQNAGWLDVV